MSVIHVQQYQIDEYWPKVEKLLADALSYSQGEMDVSQLRFSIARGMSSLFVAIEDGTVTGAAAVEFVNYPNFRSAVIMAIGGVGVVKHFEDFKQWLKFGGATKMEGCCRPSIVRLWRMKLGMKEAYTVMRGDL